jgi:hypothetical protein
MLVASFRMAHARWTERDRLVKLEHAYVARVTATGAPIVAMKYLTSAYTHDYGNQIASAFLSGYYFIAFPVYAVKGSRLPRSVSPETSSRETRPSSRQFGSYAVTSGRTPPGRTSRGRAIGRRTTRPAGRCPRSGGLGIRNWFRNTAPIPQPGRRNPPSSPPLVRL